MFIEALFTSIMMSLVTILGPLTQTIKIYKKSLAENSYIITQRVLLAFQFLFAALCIASLSYQLVVKKKTTYENSMVLNLITYSITLLFTIFNLIYFKYFVLDYELSRLNINTTSTLDQIVKIS